ncbi:lck-interacting transmembrane adapter 1 [Erinaceus europaeus]|uniref:Lck-interacting transmembrane adapter 1 n=1 Tax=Erinaceus europaeus TaxID=9365 RepID=A0A1S2ZU27_ERIEU|nr:lck-interacting transmembrane adapter 1 [Erinaceus europaeus]
MGPQVPWVTSALWALGSLALLLGLWTLCTACHRKQAQRQQAGLQGMEAQVEEVAAWLSLGPGWGHQGTNGLPCPQPLLKRPHIHSLSKSETRLHDLPLGPRSSRASRPASMDLHTHWREVSKSITRPPAAFSHGELPQARPAAALMPCSSPNATYSNVGLAAIPRALLAASPVVLTGTWLNNSHVGPEARPLMPEYACIQKFKAINRAAQGLEQGQLAPGSQVDALYSQVSKPKRRDPGPGCNQGDSKDRGATRASDSNLAYEALPPRGLDEDCSPLQNVYESIQEVGAQRCLEPPGSSC